MANFEFIILPNTSHGRPSFAVSCLNKEDNLLIITLCGKYFHQKCTNAVIIERRGNNDANIISMIADMKFQLVVLDDCFYDAIDADALLKKVQLLQIEKEFKIIVFSQYASLIIHKKDLPKASIVWLPENYKHTSFNSNNLRYYNNAAIDK
jgi:hypothetical protein